MQHILNGNDRNRAFLQFLALFLLTTALVVAAVYFNFRVPLKENQLLTDQISTQLLADQKQQKFINKMNEVEGLLDSMEKETTKASGVRLSLDGRLSELVGLQENENPVYDKMNSIIVNNLSLMEKRIIDLKSKSEAVEVWKAKLEDCKNAPYSNRQVFPVDPPQQPVSGR